MKKKKMMKIKLNLKNEIIERNNELYMKIYKMQKPQIL